MEERDQNAGIDERGKQANPDDVEGHSHEPGEERSQLPTEDDDVEGHQHVAND